jgi:hypothetical protein
MTNEELVNTVCPILNDNGWKYYFTPNAIEVGKSMGLKGMEFYVAGRGGCMGDCEGSVVAAAFGYFNPVIINAAWSLATAKQPARVIGDAHYEVAAHLGREKLAALPGLNEFTAAMEKVFNAADPDGLALFAAFKSMPLAEDTPGRAMQLAASLREFRGSAHLIAIRAVGLTSKQAHYVKRPNDVKGFGWGEDDAPVVDDLVRALMVLAENLTDALCIPAYAVLNDAERKALVDGVKAFESALK